MPFSESDLHLLGDEGIFQLAQNVPICPNPLFASTCTFGPIFDHFGPILDSFVSLSLLPILSYDLLLRMALL